MLQGSVINMPPSAWGHQAESGTGGKWLLFNKESLEGSTYLGDSLFLLPDIPTPVNLLRVESGLQAPSLASIPRAASPGCPCSPINGTHLELSIGRGEGGRGREEEKPPATVCHARTSAQGSRLSGHGGGPL